MTILIIDDDPLSRGLVKRLLEMTLNIAAVVETGDSGEGLRLARELGPTAVLMDIATLHQDGLEAIRRIKAERPTTRVIALTHHNEHAYRTAAVQSAVDAFLPKEILTQRLLYGAGSSVLKSWLATQPLNEGSRLPSSDA